ncbi:MAG: hypothetical protein V4556_04580 [Bacteroidota bacterium]
MRITIFFIFLCSLFSKHTFSQCQTTQHSTHISICDSYLPYIWHNVAYVSPGTYIYRLTNAAGCDSIDILNLNVKHSSSSNTQVSVCNFDLPYTWNGLVFNGTGSQTAHFINAVGCDSLTTLTLHIKPSSTSNSSYVTCSSLLPFLWNGTAYSAAGTYTKKLINYYGCDSLATLNLSVASTSASSTSLSICASSFPYLWNGISCTQPGTYKANLFNYYGCDSTATLNLSLRPNKWEGSIDSSWENPGNWECGTVPDANTDVIINSGSVILDSDRSVRSLYINPNASLTITEGHQLNILN